MGDKAIHIALLAIACVALVVLPISANAAHYDHKKPHSKPKISSFFRVQLFHHHHKEENRDKSRKTLLLESLDRDRSRVRSFNQRFAKSRPATASSASLEAHVESGLMLGAGEYFVDMFIGTPPRKFQLTMDTGSDLNWVQCLPCDPCYKQEGPLYNAKLSSSHRPVRCSAPVCCLVSGPEDTPAACNTTTCTKAPSSHCPYFYSYGDGSNTTGELAFETFTLNRSSATPVPVPVPLGGVVFGCGYANRGLFGSSGGLLGLGGGQLSFASHLRRYYGHKFAYCLVDRNSNLSVTSTLIFGEDHRGHAAGRGLQYTALVSGYKDTFYILNVSSLTVGGKRVNVPSHVLAGVIDSGSTVTSLAQPVYGEIKKAFKAKIGYAKVHEGMGQGELCYNVSGVADVKLPEFSIQFGDGAVWKFPVENYFMYPNHPDKSVVCLAVEKNEESFSILGNILQQNFYILYDVENSRLGFKPMACAGL